jgi:DNA-binding GntR family transcriptional regulator
MELNPPAIRVVPETGLDSSPPEHGTTVLVATAALRDAIVSGVYPPGSRVIESEVAARLGMSRTPVREAIRRLGGEGIIEHVPNRGAVVPAWDRSAIKEVFDLREMLESHAIRLAAKRGSRQDIETLREATTEMRALESDSNERRWDAYAILNNRFHRHLFTMAGSERLEAILVGLIAVPLLHRNFDSRTVATMKRSNDHHDEIVAAIEAGDDSWAATSMALHVRSTANVLLSGWVEADALPEAG